MAVVAGCIPDAAGGRALEEVLEKLPLGIAMLDEELRYLYVNDVLAALNGFPAEAHIGRRIDELLPHVPDAVLDPARRALETGEVVDRSGLVVETAAAAGIPRSFRGRWIPLAGSVLAVISEDTSPAGIDEVVVASERRYRTLVEASAGVVWRADSAGRAHFDSEPLTADPAGDHWLDAVHPSDRQRVRAAWAAAVADGTSWESEHRLRRSDGSWRHVSVRAVPILQDGRVVEWVGTTTDVSEAREAAARLRLAVEAARMGTFEWEVPLDRVRWGPETAVLFGLEPTAVEVSYADVMALFDDETRLAVERALAAAIAGGGAYEHELRVDRPDGPAWLLIRGRFERDELGQPVSMMGTAIDITERHALLEASRRSAERAAQLGSVAAALSDTLGAAEVATAVLEQAQAALGATGGAVILFDDDGETLRWAAVLGYDHDIAEAMQAVGLEAERPLTAAVRTRQPQFVGDRHEMAARFPAIARVFAAAGDEAACALPLSTGGRLLGAVTLTFDRPRPFDADDRLFLMALADTCAQAFDRARLYEREHEVAEVLQRALLPDRLAHQDGLELAARYVAGTEGVAVGGDWYDVFDLGDGRVGIAVGDVVGKGVAAAAVMGRLRNALRAHATAVDAPGEVLARVDDFALRFGSDDLATVLYGVLDVGTGELRLASAGHLPPLLADPAGTATLLRFEPGVPVGVPDAGVRPEHRLRLAPGATLVLYSDGLVEDRRRPLDEGLTLLTDVAATVVGAQDVDAACDGIVDRLVGGGSDDDLALLLVRWTGSPSDDRLSAVLPATAGSARRARLLTREQLQAWGHPELTEVAVLCVSELVTNALVHARSAARLTMTRHDGCIRFEVVDDGTAPPEKQDAAPDAVHGRGVAIVETLATDWGVDDAPGGGKAVWFELVLP